MDNDLIGHRIYRNPPRPQGWFRRLLYWLKWGSFPKWGRNWSWRRAQLRTIVGVSESTSTITIDSEWAKNPNTGVVFTARPNDSKERA